jgi:hypothetical protein
MDMSTIWFKGLLRAVQKYRKNFMREKGRNWPDFPKFSSLQIQIMARTLLTSFMKMMVELFNLITLLLWLSNAEVSDSSVTLPLKKNCCQYSEPRPWTTLKEDYYSVCTLKNRLVQCSNGPKRSKKGIVHFWSGPKQDSCLHHSKTGQNVLKTRQTSSDFESFLS